MFNENHFFLLLRSLSNVKETGLNYTGLAITFVSPLIIAGLISTCLVYFIYLS